MQHDNKIINEIKSFLYLPIGWNYGIGEPSNLDVVNMAIELYLIGESCSLNIEPMPNTDGSITLIFSKNEEIKEYFLNITVCKNLSLDIVLENNFTRMNVFECKHLKLDSFISGIILNFSQNKMLRFINSNITEQDLEEIENSSLKCIIEYGYKPIAITVYHLEDTFIFETNAEAKKCYEELEVERKLVQGWFYGKDEFEVYRKEYEDEYKITMLIKKIYYKG
jgi:hypothetical protein